MPQKKRGRRGKFWTIFPGKSDMTFCWVLVYQCDFLFFSCELEEQEQKEIFGEDFFRELDKEEWPSEEELEQNEEEEEEEGIFNGEFSDENEALEEILFTSETIPVVNENNIDRIVSLLDSISFDELEPLLKAQNLDFV